MGHLRRRMHPRIGAAGNRQSDGLPQHQGQRVLQDLLNGAQLGMALPGPTMEIRAIIGQIKANTDGSHSPTVANSLIVGVDAFSGSPDSKF